MRTRIISIATAMGCVGSARAAPFDPPVETKAPHWSSPPRPASGASHPSGTPAETHPGSGSSSAPPSSSSPPAPPPGEVIEIEASAPVRPTTATERVIDAATIATTPRRSADDLVRAVPGLYVSRHGGEGKAPQFFWRGFDAVHGSDLEVVVAGVPINEPSNVHGHGYVDLGLVIPEVVREVRARPGSFALDQGDFATAGSLGLELGTARRGARVSYEAGTPSRHRVAAVLAPARGPDEEVIAVEAVRDAGFGDNRAADRIAAVAQTRLALGAGGWLQPVAFAHAARFGEPGVMPLAEYRAGRIGFADAYAVGEGRSQRVLVGARGGRGRSGAGVWLGWRELSLDDNFTGWLIEPELGDRRLQRHGSLAAGGSGEWRRAVGRYLDVVIGGEARLERLHQTEDQLSSEGQAWRRNRELDGWTTSGSGRAGIEAGAGAWRLAAGARLDAVDVVADDRLAMRHGTGTRAVASPRVTLAWDSAGWSVLAGYGRGLRSPEARAFVAADGGADVDHSQYAGGEAAITVSDAAELGLRVGSDALTVTAGGFVTVIDREALFDHVSGANIELDSTRRVGITAAAAGRPTRWLDVRGEATVVDARFDVTGNPVPGVPELLLQGEAHAARGRWSGGVRAIHVGARPLAHGATGAATTVVDAMAAWRHRGLGLELAIDNLLGQRWYEGEYHFASWWDRSQPRSTLPTIHYSAGHPFGARLSAIIEL